MACFDLIGELVVVLFKLDCLCFPKLRLSFVSDLSW